VSHPTLSRLQSARGQTKLIRAVTLDRLAKALRVPAEWLTGERPDLPYVPEWDFIRPKGAGPSHWEKPTVDDVRWSWLMQHAERSIRRDLSEWYGEEVDEIYKTWGRALLGVLPRLASSMVWRSVTLRSSPPGSSHDLWKVDEALSDRWLEHILEPWFQGKAHLNARGLHGLLRAMLAASPDLPLLGSDVADQYALDALERYETKCDDVEQARVDTSFEP
jgi:hypothetical protein